MRAAKVSGTLSVVGFDGSAFVLSGRSMASRSAYDSLSPLPSHSSSCPHRLRDWRSPMSNTAQRLTASRLTHLSTDLTAREHDALRALATVHVAATNQVARIVYPREASADRLARRSLQRLRNVGLVRRFADRARRF